MGQRLSSRRIPLPTQNIDAVILGMSMLLKDETNVTLNNGYNHFNNGYINIKFDDGIMTTRVIVYRPDCRLMDQCAGRISDTSCMICDRDSAFFISFNSTISHLYDISHA